MIFLQDHSLKDLNTFRVPAKASYFAEFTSKEELINVIKDPRFRSISKFILGSGSNILLTKDFNGLVLKNSIKGIKVKEETDDHVFIEAGAGELWDDLVAYTVENNFYGIENLTLIPGTVGAAPIQNIGAYGVEIFDVFRSLEGYFLADGEKRVFLRDKCEFGYRSSIFKTKLKNSFVITKVTLQLSKEPKFNLDYSSLKSAVAEIKGEVTLAKVRGIIKSIRESKLPDPETIGNAGSFFKNPELSLLEYEQLKQKHPDVTSFATGKRRVKVSAAWLIEKCGLKGLRFGDAGTYEKHSLVIVNYNSASGKEIYNFARFIQESVNEKFNIILEPEVNIIK